MFLSIHSCDRFSLSIYLCLYVREFNFGICDNEVCLNTIVAVFLYMVAELIIMQKMIHLSEMYIVRSVCLEFIPHPDFFGFGNRKRKIIALDSNDQEKGENVSNLITFRLLCILSYRLKLCIMCCWISFIISILERIFEYFLYLLTFTERHFTKSNQRECWEILIFTAHNFASNAD